MYSFGSWGIYKLNLVTHAVYDPVHICWSGVGYIHGMFIYVDQGLESGHTWWPLTGLNMRKCIYSMYK